MLMRLEPPLGRKREPYSVFGSGRYSRRTFLERLRDEIAILTAMEFAPSVIAHMLGIAEDDARALSPKTRRMTMRRDLTRRAVNALLHGRHAHLGGRTAGSRAKRLVEIAAAYTREELLEEPGVGTVTATEIAYWLEARGATLRPPAPPPDHLVENLNRGEATMDAGRVHERQGQA